ncbi:MAG: hypothetical protein HY329_25215 [Chloroflexi bacterium]|nr:hypothetical protein [Chloroflexota bacterium]
MQPNAQRTDENVQAPPFGPLREQTWADHDEPWQYRPYHLGLRVKLALLRNRERMIAAEFSVGSS